MRPTSKIRKVPLAGGRVELRFYRAGRLIEVRRTSPAGATIRRRSHLTHGPSGSRQFDF